MSGIKWLVDQFLQLPRWEKIGNAALILFILVSILIMNFWPERELSKTEIRNLDVIASKFENESNNKSGFIPKNYSQNNSSTYIDDITKATANDFQKAGLSKKVAWKLFNYLKKGGKIKAKSDLAKIYGMTPEMVELFYGNLNPQHFVTFLDSSALKQQINTSQIKKDFSLININTADSSQLVSIRGISPKMAPYILKFRNSVGAFYSLEQLNEVFKSPLKNFDEIKNQITIGDFKPFIKINSISAVELKKHKYFSKDNLAFTLVAYREKHGNFKAPEDLKKCVLITDEILEKIKPYLIFE